MAPSMYAEYGWQNRALSQSVRQTYSDAAQQQQQQQAGTAGVKGEDVGRETQSSAMRAVPIPGYLEKDTCAIDCAWRFHTRMGARKWVTEGRRGDGLAVGGLRVLGRVSRLRNNENIFR